MTRPARRVLLYSADEMWLSVTACMLRLRYAVTACDSAALLEHELDWQPEFDAAVLLTAREPDHCEGLMHRVKAMRPGTPVMLVAREFVCFQSTADVVLARACGNAELLERLHVLARRRRGPKKKPLPAAAALEAAAVGG